MWWRGGPSRRLPPLPALTPLGVPGTHFSPQVMHRLLYFDCYRKHPSAGLSTRLAPWPYIWGALVGVIRALAGRHAVEFQRQPAQTVALGMQILQVRASPAATRGGRGSSRALG